MFTGLVFASWFCTALSSYYQLWPASWTLPCLLIWLHAVRLLLTLAFFLLSSTVSSSGAKLFLCPEVLVAPGSTYLQCGCPPQCPHTLSSTSGLLGRRCQRSLNQVRDTLLLLLMVLNCPQVADFTLFTDLVSACLLGIFVASFCCWPWFDSWPCTNLILNPSLFTYWK